MIQAIAIKKCIILHYSVISIIFGLCIFQYMVVLTKPFQSRLNTTIPKLLSYNLNISKQISRKMIRSPQPPVRLRKAFPFLNHPFSILPNRNFTSFYVYLCTKMPNYEKKYENIECFMHPCIHPLSNSFLQLSARKRQILPATNGRTGSCFSFSRSKTQSRQSA